MPWTTPATWVAGAVLAASQLNTHLRDQLNVLRGGGLAISSQTALDFLFASSSTQLGRLAAAAGKAPRLNLAGNAWEMAYLGAGVHELAIPAAAIRPHDSGGCGILESLLMSSGRYVQGLPFDATAIESASFQLSLPAGWNEGTITAQFKTLNIAGGSGAFVFQLAGVAAGDDDSLDAAVGTFQTATDTILAAKDLMVGPQTSAITIAGTPVAGDLTRFVVQRDPTAGGDTYASDVYLLEVIIRLTLAESADA